MIVPVSMCLCRATTITKPIVCVSNTVQAIAASSEYSDAHYPDYIFAQLENMLLERGRRSNAL